MPIHVPNAGTYRDDVKVMMYDYVTNMTMKMTLNIAFFVVVVTAGLYIYLRSRASYFVVVKTQFAFRNTLMSKSL
jgi:hypothetical protein